jgi:hypothetical protein
MGEKGGIVEGLERISEDWAKNFTRSWTIEELEEGVIAFNKTDDFYLRIKFFSRFLSTRHILFVHIKTVGTYKIECKEIRFPPFVSFDNEADIKIGLRAGDIVVEKRELRHIGCRHTIKYSVWTVVRKFPRWSL